MDCEREEAVYRLGEIDVEMMYKDHGHVVYNCQVKVIRKPDRIVSVMPLSE